MATDQQQWERACTQGIPLMLDGRTDEEVSKTLGVSIHMASQVRRRSGLAWLERNGDRWKHKPAIKMGVRDKFLVKNPANHSLSMI
jgi:hypothetical protein